jgi:hypothetical protein
MMEEQTIKTIVDTLGARAVLDHIVGQHAERVRVAAVLAFNNGGLLTQSDIETIAALDNGEE